MLVHPETYRRPGLLQQGFSLIELLVVVAIIGVLAGAGAYAYSQYLESVRGKTAENYLDKVARALDTDITATNNNLSGGTDLVVARSTIANELTAGAQVVDADSCEAFALSVVKKINESEQNVYNKQSPSAAYGNIIQTNSSGFVIGPSGFKLTRGTVIVSCNDPQALMSDTENVRLYQCVCTKDSDEQCRFSSDVETQSVVAGGGNPYTPSSCPRPPISPTGFPPGASPVRPLP